ncbi:hypothetical protein IEQ34_009953 [Dendrobium chrysotoxum]|uniref:Uncharacterized protein n=1 Tax=Dendrobium chrysotoxum TaxID=161865 RepID=A0AAV7H3W7_DENCH|nr:hypothetical protein IEQ34_009953 [Dendrobium chrysotoxum]
MKDISKHMIISLFFFYPPFSMHFDVFHVPRPLPFDTSETRYSRLQRDGLISRRDKTMSHIQDNQLIQTSGSNSDVEQLGGGKRSKNAELGGAECMSGWKEVTVVQFVGRYWIICFRLRLGQLF